MNLITTTADLAAVCERMSRHTFITVDTEFLRETTYYPLLCVAQIATSEEAVVIDALAQDLDLAPFFELMANEGVLKVFHAARQDIEIVWHQAKLVPGRIFDTQVAAMVLGYGDSISYDQLVQRITGDVIDKSNRFTDWSRRPLSAAQVTYAISDVTHLREVFLSLSADLQSRGRSEWVGEEMEVLTSPDTYRADPETAWERLKTLLRMASEQHGVAAKVIATVEDLERIALDDRADVPALHGWRREMFGEQAIALKRGRLALAVDKGRVVAVERT